MKVLYISTNDGSDMRINKEVLTLSRHAEVYFIGVGKDSDKNYVKEHCAHTYLIDGKRNSASTILKQISCLRKLLKENTFNSIHIVNEQLMVFFYPWIFKNHVVLDVFDSFFIKKNKPGNALKFLKKIVYAPAKKVIVTDANRKKLMPDFLQDRVEVLENFPYAYKGNKDKNTEYLTIFYNGSMTKSRGTQILEKLLSYSKEVRVIMAGWVNDEETKLLSQHPQTKYEGIITQVEAAHIAATQADYIMCCYEPVNENNINASPNKIFDAIQTMTPVIINKEVKVASFVKENNIGVVIDSFYPDNIEKLYNELQSRKNDFKFDSINVKEYTWDNIEDKLLAIHKLI